MKRPFGLIRLKLRCERGDTLVEALAALLIAVLGATLLATMVTASLSVSTTSQRSLDASYQAERVMPKIGFRDAATVTMGSVDVAFTVQVYQSEDGTFTRYENELPRSDGETS